jgi:hypothetical protein
MVVVPKKALLTIIYLVLTFLSNKQRSHGQRFTLIAMPRATTEKFSRAHQPAPKKKDNGSMTNPIFNTQRFGQHILKNPATAQKSVQSFDLTPYH